MRSSLSAVVWTRVLAAALACLLPAALSSADSKTESCRRFVQQFYTWYVTKSVKGFSAEDAVKAQPRSFSPVIIRALRDNEAEAKKHPGEIVGLDFDPILNAQDFAQKYIAGRVTSKGDRYLAPVYGVWNGKKNASPDVTCELQWVEGRWRFEDFHYRRDPKKPEETFSHLMDDLRREWRKGAKPGTGKK